MATVCSQKIGFLKSSLLHWAQMEHESTDLNLRNELNRSFMKKCEGNRNYSLRAFARDLKIDPTLLSRLMKGERKFSAQMVQRIVSELNLPLNNSRELTRPKGKILNENAFNPISKWYFFGILELMGLPRFKSDAEWIAKRLNLSVAETNAALQVLSDAAHIDMSGKRWKVITTESSWADLNSTSRDRMNYQKQLLEKGKEAIDEVDFARRENASLTISASRKLVPEIKKKIHKFKNELRDYIENHSPGDDVYQIVISYFPLTKDGSERK